MHFTQIAHIFLSFFGPYKMFISHIFLYTAIYIPLPLFFFLDSWNLEVLRSYAYWSQPW